MRASLRRATTVSRRSTRKTWAQVRRNTPGKDQILASPWMAPVRSHLQDDCLWHIERQGVARGVAAGLFMGLLMPVAQILFAVVASVLIRGNVPISAACTLVTNPFTVPPIYYAAYQIGERVLPESLDMGWLMTDATHWLGQSLNWAVSHGAPLMTGLLLLATTSAMVGFAGVHLFWSKR
ncbi:MAG: DUF2062 domain-containing protein [Aquabacterium sp.]|nr:DUF2062 domain-containing protein [Aquabacterium sp.]